MTRSFNNPGSLAGFLGSVIFLSSIVIGTLFPNSNLPAAPFYGVGSLLLLVNAVSLLLLRKGRPEWLAYLSLAVAILGLGLLTYINAAQILSGLGVGIADDYWDAAVLSLFATIVGISAYAVTVVIARALVAWIGLSLAAAGAGMISLAVIFMTGVSGVSSTTNDFLGGVFIAFGFVLFAMWGLMSLMLTRVSSEQSPATRNLAPHSDIVA
ncbi:MAG: hypothetical protein ABIQ44_00100 [Chloroflexia bacterium]